MPFKRALTIISILLSTINCVAQQNIEKKNRLTNQVIERFYVQPDNQQIKDGPYHAFFRRRVVVAEGNYTKGKRSGTWHFYNTKGALFQTYNFDKDSLEFEGRERVATDFHYLVDKEISDTDRVTKPVKIGGRYYGFLPYLGVYKTPFDVYQSSGFFVAQIELLISPLGRLAEYKVRLVSPILEIDQTVTLSLNFFNEDDKKFIPATINYKPVLSRIFIKCRVTEDGELDFY